jgi:large subunit ribosomal protein L21
MVFFEELIFCKQLIRCWEVNEVFAVVKNGSKQLKVAVGDKIRVEKLHVAPGSEVILDKVVVLADEGQISVGTPHVAGASVVCKTPSHGRARKVIVFKFKKRKNYKKTLGHRQEYTKLEVVGINKG